MVDLGYTITVAPFRAAAVGEDDSSTYQLGSVVARHPSRIRGTGFDPGIALLFSSCRGQYSDESERGNRRDWPCVGKVHYVSGGSRGISHSGARCQACI